MLDLLAGIIRGDTTAWPEGSAGPNGPASPHSGDDAARAAAFLTVAARHGVDALVTARLEAGGHLQGWPLAIGEELILRALKRAAIEILVREEVRRVLDGAAATGLAPLLIKGAGLAYTCYPDPVLRPRCDTDLLVADAQVPAAKDLLLSLGYSPLHSFGGELVSYQAPYVKTDAHGLHHRVDLHWRIANPQVFAHALTFAEAAGDSIPAPSLHPRARATGPLDSLLVACVHRVAHHRRDDRLMWLYDIHLLVEGLSAGEVAQFARRAAEKGVRAVCLDGTRTASKWFHTRVPADLIEALGRGSREATDGYLDVGRRKVDDLADDLKTVAGWPARMRLVREHILPPAPAILTRYGTTRRVLLPVLYTHRLLAGARRWIRRS